MSMFWSAGGGAGRVPRAGPGGGAGRGGPGRVPCPAPAGPAVSGVCDRGRRAPRPVRRWRGAAWPARERFGLGRALGGEQVAPFASALHPGGWVERGGGREAPAEGCRGGAGGVRVAGSGWVGALARRSPCVRPAGTGALRLGPRRSHAGLTAVRGEFGEHARQGRGKPSSWSSLFLKA